MCMHVFGGHVPQAMTMWAAHHQIVPRKYGRAVNEPTGVGGYAHIVTEQESYVQLYRALASTLD